MHERQEASNQRETPNQLVSQARPKTQVRTRLHVLPGSQNVTDAAKQFRRGDSIVGREQRVSPCDRMRLIASGSLVKNAVSDQFALPGEQNDISYSNLPHNAPLKEKNVARPHGGKHAQARDFQSQRAERPQNLRSKLALQRVLAVPRIGLVLLHDSFLFIVQEACVVLTFPHDSADVTKTRS
jgi:hypothetical protein